MSQSAVQPGALAVRAALAAGEGAASQAQALYRLLVQLPSEALPADHAEAGRGREHALFTAAVAYCLGHELRAAGAAVDPDLLRLAALAHDVPLDDAARALLPAPVRRWIGDRRLFFDALPGSPFPINYFNSPSEQALYAAHLVASLPLPVTPARPAPVAFREHPLGRGHLSATVALVYVRPDRSAAYLFEAPGLVELRGGAHLLDRVARVEVPALFGAAFEEPEDAARAEAVRAWFAGRTELSPLTAPECLVTLGAYTLALVPASLATIYRDAIEALYIEATQAVACVAIARPCELLELQYGRQPSRFWTQEYEAARADPDLRVLLANDRHFEAPPDPGGFPGRKGAGELLLELDLAAQRRTDERAVYPNWEVVPFTLPCPACERRPAAATTRAGQPRCVPCARKHAAGATAGPWERALARYLASDGRESYYAQGCPPEGWEVVAVPDTAAAVAAASVPSGYIGLLCLEAHDLPERLYELRHLEEIQLFTARVADATETAVCTALATHLRPYCVDGRWVHPFTVLPAGAGSLLLLVPGAVALALAATLALQFEQAFGTPGPGGHGRGGAGATELPLSGGVVVAPAAVPLTMLHDLARDLLAAARRGHLRARRERPGASPGGYCDFLIVPDVALPSVRLAGLRAHRRVERDGVESWIGASPYTWPEIRALLATARDLVQSGCRRGDLEAVAALLARGDQAASLEYLYLRARAPQRARAALGRLEAAWTTNGAHPEVPPPWRWLPPRGARERRETAFPDLVAILDFAAERLDVRGGDELP